MNVNSFIDGKGIGQRSPYRGFARFTSEYQDLLAGREQDTKDCVEKLLRPGCAMLLLHGESGCGKSSFIEAALLPRFDSTREHHGWRHIYIRLGENPLQDLFRKFQSVGGELQENRENDELSHVVASANQSRSVAHDSLIEMLTQLFRLVRRHDSRLIFVLDQVEDIFQMPQEVRHGYLEFLADVATQRHPGRFVVAMRTDFKARFDDEMLRRKADHARIESHYLHFLGDDELREAIIRPAKAEEFEFSYAQSIPDFILEEVKKEHNLSHRLPLLQIICSRVYGRARAESPSGRIEIDEYTFRSTGSSRLQLQFHIESLIAKHYAQNTTGGDLDVAGEVDRWQRVLYAALVKKGQTQLAAPPTPLVEVEQLARENGCRQPTEMIKWLATPENSVLRLDGAGGGARQGLQVSIVHDSIATALRGWHDDAQALAGTSWTFMSLEGPSSSSYEQRLYRATPADEVVIRTINNQIWDHILPLYAEHCKFTTRVGIRIVEDDSIERGDAWFHSTAFPEIVRKQAEHPVPFICVLPSSIFPEILQDPWIPIGIPNLYCGYAIIGRGVDDPNSQPDGDDAAQATRRLTLLAERLKHSSARVLTSEAMGQRFVRAVCRFGNYPRVEPNILDPLRATDPNSPRDPFFRALVKDPNVFVCGPAPTKALCQQAGFPVLADFKDLHTAVPEEERSGLKDLLMPESLVVVGIDRESPVLLRLFSAMLCASDAVRSNPDAFARFVYNHSINGPTGVASPLHRRSIRDATLSSYLYLGSREYTAMRIANSDTSSANHDRAFSDHRVHDLWLACKARYFERLALRFSAGRRDRLSAEGKVGLLRAEAHASIMNYGDACSLLEGIPE